MLKTDIKTDRTMKKYFIIPIALLLSSGLQAQGLYNNGGKIVVPAGITLYISGAGGNYVNETHVSNASIALNGTLRLDGNYTNNVAGSDILSTVGTASQVAFTGTASQTLGGSTTAPFVFNNLAVNNAAGVVLSKNATVNGVLTLASGLAGIGNNDLILGSAATVAGTPSASAMIVATGTGHVNKVFAAAGSFTFPVGDNTIAPEYSPVTLNFVSGTFAPGASAGVNLVNAPYPDPYITGSFLKRYWNLTQTGITGFSCDAAFNYTVADVIGTESAIYCLRITPPPVVPFDASNIVLHQLTANGLSSFGTFTGGPGQKSLILKLYLEGLYSGGGMMNPAMSFDGVDLLPKWGWTIADHITVELHDATNYYNVINTTSDIPLNTDGTAAVILPGNYNGNYYITIKHRNSIETVCATPQTFAGSTISYDFSDAASKAFGDNMKSMGGGKYAFFAGDITDFMNSYPGPAVQDGIVDILDQYYVYPSYLAGDLGYLPSDLNGDGIVDIFDLYLDYDNYLLGVYAMTP